MIETKPLEVIDFSGGITDYFIDGRPEQAEEMDNLVINTNQKLITRWGSEVYENSQIPLGSFRISHIAFLNDNLLAYAQKKVYYIDTGTWVELQGPAADPVFFAGDANTLPCSTEWQGHLFTANNAFSSVQKIYYDNAGDIQVRNAGLPAVPSGVSIANPTGAGSTYLYAFNLKYTYMVGPLTFIDRGPVYYYPTLVTGGVITSGNGALITLPTSLTLVENWDEANIEIEIARTLDGGTDYFYIQTVALGTASYNDENDDADISDYEVLYTTGGVYSNDTPPKCKFVHVVNDAAYYAHLLEGSEEDAYLVRQSITGDPDSVPTAFFAKTEQPINGLSSIFDRPIVLCEKYIYRIDNTIDSTGVGNMDLRRIDDRAGCVSNASVVRTHKGLFWAGEIGFYWSDGFKVLKISDNLNNTYKSFITNATRKSRIVGAYEPSNDRIYWSVSVDDGSNEPDKVYILDLKFFNAIQEGQGVFTTMSNSTFFRPTALAVNNNMLYRGDTRGYVLRHASTLFTDPKIDVAVTPDDWEVLTIIHSYKSCFLDFGSKFYRKFVPRILVSADNTTNLALAITSSNDNDRVVGELQPIRYRNAITWGDELPLWGDPDALWNVQGLIEEWRRFPARGLRCNYKQIQFTNALIQILTSSLLGTATVNGSLNTATLGGSYNWINDIVDYVIAFENDNYDREYTITARTPTTITFTDVGNNAPTGTYNWILRGKPKGEVLLLNGYVIHWSFLSKSHKPFGAGSLGSPP